MTSTLTWGRHTEGFYQATSEGGDYYRIRREDSRRYGRSPGWEIAVWRAGGTTAPPASPDVRRGRFSKLDLAKVGAGNTKCIRCERPRMLADLDQVAHTIGKSYETYVCRRDKDECRRVQLENEAREAEELAESMKRTDHNQIEIRETQYGPDLVVGRTWTHEGTGIEQGNATVLGLTEDDLARIERVIHERRQDQAAALRWKKAGPDRRYLSESTAPDLEAATSIDIPMAGRYGWGDADLVRVVSEEGTYFCGRVTYLSALASRITIKMMGREDLPSKAGE